MPGRSPGRSIAARAAAPIETTGAAGAGRRRGAAARGAPQGQKPRAPHLPGAAHRRERRAGRTERRAGRACLTALKPGGRMCIITFHSLEDRLVKQRFRQWATACTCPPEFPVCVCGGEGQGKAHYQKAR